MPHPHPAAPCQHIADYYDVQWWSRKCIAFNLLRHGYRAWSAGRVTNAANNLFEVSVRPPASTLEATTILDLQPTSRNDGSAFIGM